MSLVRRIQNLPATSLLILEESSRSFNGMTYSQAVSEKFTTPHFELIQFQILVDTKKMLCVKKDIYNSLRSIIIKLYNSESILDKV